MHARTHMRTNCAVMAGEYMKAKFCRGKVVTFIPTFLLDNGKGLLINPQPVVTLQIERWMNLVDVSVRHADRNDNQTVTLPRLCEALSGSTEVIKQLHSQGCWIQF